MGNNAYSVSERECLARAMYFESNRSSEDGMLAVGTVVMNRLQSAKYPKSLCGVVGEPRQFADGALTKPAGGASFTKALKVADSVIAGDRHPGVGPAMHFHTAGYRYPYRNMYYVVAAGGNVFYEKRQPGTFTPVNPATLIARAEPKTPKADRILLADASEEVPLPSFRPKTGTDDVKPLRGPRRELARASDDEDETPAPRGKSLDVKAFDARALDAKPVGAKALDAKPRERTARTAEPKELDAKPRRSREARADRETDAPKHKSARSERTRIASADDSLPPPRPRLGEHPGRGKAALDERGPEQHREKGTRKREADAAPVTARPHPKKDLKAAELKDLDLPSKR